MELERRKLILQCLNSGMSVRDIMAFHKIAKSTIYDVKRRLKKTGEMGRKKNERKRTVVTPKFKAKMQRKIQLNPSKTIRAMARELKVGETSIRRAVKELGMKSRAKSKRFRLTMRLKALRLERCQKIISILKKRSQFCCS